MTPQEAQYTTVSLYQHCTTLDQLQALLRIQNLVWWALYAPASTSTIPIQKARNL